VAQKIFNYLQENSNGTIPGCKQGQEALGVSRGYASVRIQLRIKAIPILLSDTRNNQSNMGNTNWNGNEPVAV